MSGEGAYIVLKREDSRQLNGLTEDEAVRRFTTELRRSKKYQDEGWVLECGTAWNAIHRCLTEGTLDPNAGEFPLNCCVLGGRRLYRGTGFEAVLIRPDIVPHVAMAVRDVKRSDLHERYFKLDPNDYGQQPSEKEFDLIWNTFRQIQQLMDEAGELRAAVLFTVER